MKQISCHFQGYLAENVQLLLLLFFVVYAHPACAQSETDQATSRRAQAEFFLHKFAVANAKTSASAAAILKREEL